jgi:hypothetical protein
LVGKPLQGAPRRHVRNQSSGNAFLGKENVGGNRPAELRLVLEEIAEEPRRKGHRRHISEAPAAKPGPSPLRPGPPELAQLQPLKLLDEDCSRRHKTPPNVAPATRPHELAPKPDELTIKRPTCPAPDRQQPLPDTQKERRMPVQAVPVQAVHVQAVPVPAVPAVQAVPVRLPQPRLRPTTPPRPCFEWQAYEAD